jgi:hypothetical protein
MTAAMSLPPWSPMPRPDFRIPTGQTHFPHLDHLEPPPQFVRWTDRLENVLSADKTSILEVDRRCRAAGAKSQPGKIIHGCAYRIVQPGRCFIIRIDDPGVARHELAHCNGWPPDHPTTPAATTAASKAG